MILLGIVFIASGTLMLVFHQSIYNFTGGLDFIESHFRAGTPAFLKLVAVVLVLLGILMATGLGGWITEPVTKGLNNLFPKN